LYCTVIYDGKHQKYYLGLWSVGCNSLACIPCCWRRSLTEGRSWALPTLLKAGDVKPLSVTMRDETACPAQNWWADTVDANRERSTGSRRCQIISVQEPHLKYTAHVSWPDLIVDTCILYHRNVSLHPFIRPRLFSWKSTSA
jgi:hypothetical protein